MPRYRFTQLALAAILALLLVTPSIEQGRAQIPSTFTNLQILPKDSNRGQVVAVMRDFANALGVRCNHCHVGENAATLEGFDFASDAKERKRVARVMMRMTREINGHLLTGVERTPRLEVRCFTCHHGVQRPQTLVEIMMAQTESAGVQAAIAEYDRLRGQYYGQAAYDFSSRSLSQVAEGVAQRLKNLDGAIAVMEFSIKHYPDMPYSHYQLGELHVQKGDKTAGLAAMEQALKLAPDDGFIKGRIEQLRKPATPPQ